MGRTKKYPGVEPRGGKWRKRFTFNGKRFTVYGDTQQETWAEYWKLKEKLEAGGYKANDKITLSEYFREWLDRKTGSVSEKTIFDYEQNFRLHVKPAVIAGRKVKEIERREIIRFQQELARKATAQVANHTVLILHGVLKSAVLDEIIERNPADGIPRLKDKRRPARETIHRALTLEELDRFMEAAEGTWHYRAFRLLLATGIRAGELGALEWGDVDYGGKFPVLHIRRTVTRDRDGKWIIGETTKTSRSRRDIPLNDEILSILAEQGEFYDALHGEKIRDIHARIFERPDGGIIAACTINQAIRNVLRKLEKEDRKRQAAQGIAIVEASVAPFSAHAFRDTFATMAIMQKMAPNTLKEILGHASLAMTMDLYAHVLDSEKKQEMESLQIYAARR